MSPRRSLLAILTVVAVLFATGVALQLHGFSLAAWHGEIDGSEPSEVLLGEPQTVRWDDWMVLLPLALAQVAHDPPFALVNRDIGAGQNMLAPIAAPVWHPLALFRPTLWGFFLGPDVGIAWLWWTQLLGLFAVWLVVFAVVSRGAVGVSLVGALLLVFAPLFQLFSFNAAPFAIAMGLAWLAAVRLLSSARPASILASGVVLGWSGACFALMPYPPYQVPLAYLFLVLLAGFVWQRRSELDLRAGASHRVLAFGIAATILAAAAALFWHEAGATIAVMRATEYPGRRLELGGTVPFWQLVNASFLLPLQVKDFGPLGPYISSSASFFISWPLVAGAVVLRAATRREKLDPLMAVLAIYCAAITFFCAFGVPEPVAKASLFAAVPARRSLLGLGLADTLLLVSFLGRRRLGAFVPAGAAALLAMLWAIALGESAAAIRRALPETRSLYLAAAVLAQGGLAYALLRTRRPAAAPAIAAAAIAASTFWFNPLARGGSEYLLHNDLSKLILELDARAGGRSTWINLGEDEIGNLFRVLGVRSLDGVQPEPQLALWSTLDPSGAQRAQYNRFAHVHFKLGDATRFHSTSDLLAVEVADSGVLQRLGATHILVRSDFPRLEQIFRPYEPAGRAGLFVAFELPLRRRLVPRSSP